MTMRKALIVFLAAILLVSACFVSLHTHFLAIGDDVTVTRQTLYGDPAAAEGARILVRNHYNQRLLWETSMTLGDGGVPETNFTFSNEPINIYRETEYNGLSFHIMSNHVFFFMNGELPEYAAAKYAALAEAISDQEKSVGEGETKTFGIDYAQYLDYYPLEGQVILPEITAAFTDMVSWTEDSNEIAKAINEFFRIPLDGLYTVDYTYDRTGNSRSYGALVNLDYHLNASGVATENACYFTFNTLKEDGSVVDTSLIPGGYGIYRLPYDENGLQLDDLEMVYALDPAHGYERLELSGDGERLRLLTWQGNDLMLTVIDLATMSRLQEVRLATQSEEWRYDVIGYDDFMLIVENRNNSDSMDRITVWEEQSDGAWGHALTADMNMDVFPEGGNLGLFNSYTNAVDYQNGKLVILKNRRLHQEPYWYKEYCDIYVTVYDATGMVYAGTCQWNLTQVNRLEPYGTRVYPAEGYALEVSW